MFKPYPTIDYFFVLKMLSAFHVCCIHSKKHFSLDFFTEANDMNPAFGAV